MREVTITKGRHKEIRILKEMVDDPIFAVLTRSRVAKSAGDGEFGVRQSNIRL